tara:strand:- start:18898 stop:19392 length:495 start_codon:yes stop_codon:yes gene_type:complete
VKRNLSREVAYVGLGSNLSNPKRNVNDALAEIGQLRHVELIATSSLYRSEPVGVVDQPRFINAVCKVLVSVGPDTLLHFLLDIEAKFGRIRTMQNGPRIIDLDVLLYGELRYVSPNVSVPHPRMFSRAFVLKPLLEIEPDMRMSKNFISMVSKEVLNDPSVTKV